MAGEGGVQHSRKHLAKNVKDHSDAAKIIFTDEERTFSSAQHLATGTDLNGSPIITEASPASSIPDHATEHETGGGDIVSPAGIGAIPSSEKGAANGVTPLDAGSKVDEGYLPAIAITDTFMAANETEQLALTVQKGDVCVRTDENKSYINLTGSNTSMADWVWLRTPTDAVLSVFTRTGAVAALASDYLASQIDNDSGVPGAFVKDALDALKTDDTSCSVYDSTGVSISTGAWTKVTLDSEEYDTDSLQSGGTITIPIGKAGKYLVIACVTFPGNATGIRGLRLKHNAAYVRTKVSNPVGTSKTDLSFAKLLDLGEGDTVEMEGYQTTLAALITEIGADRTFLQAVRQRG